MTAKPTIVLVTGAFHVASHMSLFQSCLKEVGYTCISFSLKSVNTPKLTLQDDVDYLRKALQGLVVDQGKEVVLYFHSYAGFPGSAAIEGLSKDEQKTQGNQGGVIGLIYQSAFIPKEGDCLYNLIGGEYAPWQAPNVGLFPPSPWANNHDLANLTLSLTLAWSWCPIPCRLSSMMSPTWPPSKQ